MTYREYAPHTALAPFVQCYWSITPPFPPVTNRVMPDGCIDILVTVGPKQYGAMIVGTMQQSEVIALDGQMAFVGVRFKPGGAAPFLRLPLHELTDAELNLNQLWGKDAVHLTERLVEITPVREQVRHIEQFLLARCYDISSLDKILAEAVYLIRSTQGNLTSKELTSRLFLSERQLERRFRIGTGLTPKLFTRIVRFRRAVQVLQHQRNIPLERLAVDLGFYDQAHFIHDFKTFSRLTPTEYLTERYNVGFLQYPTNLP